MLTSEVHIPQGETRPRVSDAACAIEVQKWRATVGGGRVRFDAFGPKIKKDDSASAYRAWVTLRPEDVPSLVLAELVGCLHDVERADRAELEADKATLDAFTSSSTWWGTV